MKLNVCGSRSSRDPRESEETVLQLSLLGKGIVMQSRHYCTDCTDCTRDAKSGRRSRHSVLLFQLVLIFGKATRKTMQALVLAALLESFVGTNDVILSARHYQHQCH